MMFYHMFRVLYYAIVVVNGIYFNTVIFANSFHLMCPTACKFKNRLSKDGILLSNSSFIRSGHQLLGPPIEVFL